jgi:hypothetical protein
MAGHYLIAEDEGEEDEEVGVRDLDSALREWQHEDLGPI